MKNERGSVGVMLVIVGILIIVGSVLLSIFAPFATISAGQVGVVTVMGKVSEKPIHAGFNWVSPISDVTRLNVKILSNEHVYTSASRDMQDVNVTMILNYNLEPSKAPEVYETVGEDWFHTIVIPASNEIIRAETALYPASEILKERGKIRASVHEKLSKWLAKYGINIKEVSIANVQFSNEYQKAIEQKQLQEQIAEQRKYELVKVKKEAEMAEAKAKGEANAILAKATAEAKANELLANSLNEKLLKLKYFEKWNGILPQTMLGDKTEMLLNMANK